MLFYCGFTNRYSCCTCSSSSERFQRAAGVRSNVYRLMLRLRPLYVFTWKHSFVSEQKFPYRVIMYTEDAWWIRSRLSNLHFISDTAPKYKRFGWWRTTRLCAKCKFKLINSCWQRQHGQFLAFFTGIRGWEEPINLMSWFQNVFVFPRPDYTPHPQSVLTCTVPAAFWKCSTGGEIIARQSVDVTLERAHIFCLVLSSFIFCCDLWPPNYCLGRGVQWPQTSHHTVCDALSGSRDTYCWCNFTSIRSIIHRVMLNLLSDCGTWLNLMP